MSEHKLKLPLTGDYTPCEGAWFNDADGQPVEFERILEAINSHEALIAENERLRSQVEELSKDRDRLEWLVKNNYLSNDIWYVITYRPKGCDWREAIDIASHAQKSTESIDK